RRRPGWDGRPPAVPACDVSRSEVLTGHRTRAALRGKGIGGAMQVSEGDHLVIESERVGQPPRTGTIEEVLSLDPLRVRVRWENNRVSTITPNAGAASVERSTRSARKSAA